MIVDQDRLYFVSDAYHPMTHRPVPVACPFCFGDCPLLCHLCRLLPYTPYFSPLEPIESVRGGDSSVPTAILIPKSERDVCVCALGIFLRLGPSCQALSRVAGCKEETR